MKPFKILSEKQLLDNPYLPVWQQEVELPDGSKADWYLSKSNGVVVVVPILTDGQILLQHAYKHGCSKNIWEFPAGMIDQGETPEQAAKRELLEETGYKPVKLTKLGEFFGNPTGSDNVTYFFLAEDCQQIAEPTPEPSEQIELHLFSDLATVRKQLLNNYSSTGSMAALALAVG